MNHSHVLYDADPHFKINVTSRNITNESGKTTLVQYDHNSERFTFESPRYIDGHDLSLCNSVEIHYLNVEANTKKVKSGVYTVDDLQVKDGDENTIVFSWVITRNATQLIGQLNFIVRFACISETTGAVEYAWHTTIHSGTMISTGIYNGETGSDNPVPAFNFVNSVNGTPLKFFAGSQAEYDALDVNDKVNMFAFITDNESTEGLIEALNEVAIWMNEVANGIVTVPNADHANKAKNADYATTASRATNAGSADSADSADKAKCDDQGLSFRENYLNLTESSEVFSGDAVQGVDIIGNPDGTAYLATLELEGIVYSFGVIWWDGNKDKPTMSHSMSFHMYNHLYDNYVVQITRSIDDSVGENIDTPRHIRGSATIMRILEDGGLAHGMATGQATLTLRSLTQIFKPISID